MSNISEGYKKVAPETQLMTQLSAIHSVDFVVPQNVTKVFYLPPMYYVDGLNWSL